MLRQIIITTVAVFSLAALINLLCVMPPDPNRDDNAKVKDISLENIFISSPDSNIVLIDKEFDIKLSLMLVYRIDSLTVDLDDGNDTVIMPGEWDTLLTLKHLYNSTGKKVIEATIYTATAKPKISTITAIVVKPAKLIEKEITVSRIPDSVNKGVKLSVYANGSGNIEYLWYKDTSFILKSDDSVYTIDSLTETDTGEYFCIVSNFYGSDTSFSYKLSLDEYLPPVIENERKVFSEGKMETDSRCFLYITTSDSQKLTYQWHKDNNVIINETSDTLVFSSLSVDDNGVYKCVVTNEYGSDTSLEYTIEVFENVKPIIQNNKEIVVSGSLFKSSTVTLSINASGTEPLSYSWYKEGSETVLSTEPKLTLEDLSSGAEGEYYCIVSNSFGNDTSVSYEIKLLPESKPLPVILNEKAVQTKGPPVTDSLLKLYIEVENDGKTVNNYQWFKDNIAIEKETSDTLVFSSLSVDDNGVYKCVVTNEHGSDTSREYTIEVGENVKPIIQNNKEIVVSGSLFKSSTVTLSINASGTEPLSYSWYKEGSEKVLSTEPQLTLENLSSDTEGEYLCIVTNTAGSDTSKVYRVKLKNRKPVLISQPDTFKLIENQPETVEIELNILDPDDDTVFWKIIKTPVKGTVSSDSGIIPADKPLFAYTLKPDSNEIDSIVVEYGDKELYDSLTLYFQIEPVNKPPVLFDPDTVIEIKENQTKNITYKAIDKDGDIPFLSLAPFQGNEIPDWITSTGSSESITIKFEPGYDIASNATPYVNIYFSIKISDGTDITYTTIKVTVENENRAPVFNDFPPTVSSPVGDTVEIELSGDDPDGDDVTFSINNPESGMEINGNKFSWFVPYEKHSPGESHILSLRINDGIDHNDITVKLEFKAHEWKLISQSQDTTTIFAAKNCSTIFKLENNSLNGIIYISKNNGNSWNILITLSNMTEFTPNIFHASQSTLHVLWRDHSSNYYISYIDASGNIKKRREFFLNQPSFSLSPNGEKLIGFWSGISHSYTLYYEDTFIDTVHSISSILSSPRAGNKYTWAYLSQHLYCMQNLDLEDSLYGFKPTIIRTSTYRIAIDGNDGDTIFMYDSTSLYQYVYGNTSTSKYKYINVKEIVMSTGEIGWLLSNNGEIHFTKDSFENTYKETTSVANNNIVIKKIFRAADGTMFAYGTNDGTTYLFRY